MALYIYVPILSPYVVHQGGSLSLVGLVVAAYGVPQLTIRVALGSWSDRIGQRKPALALGFAAALLSALGMWLIPVPGAFVAWRFLAGVAASVWAPYTALYLGYFPPQRTANALGFATLVYVLGQVISSFLGGTLAQNIGWAAPFWVSLIFALTGMLLMLGVREMPRTRIALTPSKDETRPRTLLRRYPDLLAASFLGIFSQIASFVTTFGYVPLWAVHIGMSRTDLGLLLMVGLIPTAAMTVMAGSVLSHRWPMIQVVAVGFTIIMLMTAITPLVPQPWWLYMTQAMLGVGRGLLTPSLMTLAVTGVQPWQRATSMATYQAIFAIGTIGGPALAGWVVGSFGLLSAFWLASMGALVGAVWAWARLSKPRQATMVAKNSLR